MRSPNAWSTFTITRVGAETCAEQGVRARLRSVPDATAPSGRKLVDFDAPPVIEVALCLQFETPVVDIGALAAFTTAVADSLPRQTSQPVLPRQDEQFGVAPSVPAFEVAFGIAAAGLPRTWFQGEGPWITQLQPDRLIVNWRIDRPDRSLPYPGYETVRERLTDHLALLQEAVGRSGRALPAVDLVEVTYVNRIEVPDTPASYDSHPDLGVILNRVAAIEGQSFLGVPEDAQYQARWRIPSSSGEPRPAGRLYLIATPTLDTDRQLPIYLLNLTARVKPTADQGSPIAALNLAHDWVVLGFKDLTTNGMHSAWGLREPPI